MPTREEENQALMSLGYSPLPDEPQMSTAPAPAALPPLPPKPVQDDYALEAANTPSVGYTPVSQPGRPAPADEPQMSQPPEPPPARTPPPPPVEQPRAAQPRPAQRRAASPVEQHEPEPGHISDADILGLPSKGKNVGLPSKDATPSATAQAPSGENPYDKQPDGIEDKHFDKSAKTRQLQAEGAAADNRALDLIGEKSDIAEGYGEQRGQINQARADQAVQSIGDAREHQAAASERYEDSRAQMDNELKALKEKMGKPPFDTVGLVMGLAGALAAAHGKPEAGRMLQQGVGGAINSRMKRWQGEIEGGQQHLDGMGKLVNMDRLHAADEEQGSLAIQKAVTAEFDSAIDEAKAQADTAEKVNALDMLQNDFRKKLGDNELAVRAKAAAAAHRRMVNQKIADAKTPEDRQWISEHFGDVGRQIQGANQKNQMNDAKLGSELLGQDKIVAETGAIGAKAQLDRAKAEKGPDTVWAPKGWVAPAGITAPMLKEVSDKAGMKATTEYAQNRLIKIAEDVKAGKAGWTDPNVAKEVNELRTMMVPMKTQFVGAGAPSGHEFETFMEATSDPQKYFQRGDSYKQLVRSRANSEGSWNQYMDALRFTKENQPGEARVAPQKRLVEFSDGTQAELRPDEIQALMTAGHRVKAVD